MAKEKIASPPASKRRYDSIAMLIQGDGVCGACCFDGRNVLLSNNLGEKSEYITIAQTYLKKVSQKCSERLDSAVLSKVLGQLKSEFLSYARAHVKLFQQNKTYASRFESALDKVTRSIGLAY